MFTGSVFLPGLHPAGQTSPVLLACCQALTCLKNSFTFLPTLSAWTSWATQIPSGLNKNLPLNATPSSSKSTPKSEATLFVVSAPIVSFNPFKIGSVSTNLL